MRIAGGGPYLFLSEGNEKGHQTTFKTVWSATLRRANVRHFRICDLRSTYATRLSAGGVADEWVTQLLRQGDANVFKKYSQMKLQMKREALQKLNQRPTKGFWYRPDDERRFWYTSGTIFASESERCRGPSLENRVKSKVYTVGA